MRLLRIVAAHWARTGKRCTWPQVAPRAPGDFSRIGPWRRQKEEHEGGSRSHCQLPCEKESVPASPERWSERAALDAQPRQPTAFLAELWGTGFGNVRSPINTVGAWCRRFFRGRTNELAQPAPQK